MSPTSHRVLVPGGDGMLLNMAEFGAMRQSPNNSADRSVSGTGQRGGVANQGRPPSPPPLPPGEEGRGHFLFDFDLFNPGQERCAINLFRRRFAFSGGKEVKIIHVPREKLSLCPSQEDVLPKPSLWWTAVRTALPTYLKPPFEMQLFIPSMAPFSPSHTCTCKNTPLDSSQQLVEP